MGSIRTMLFCFAAVLALADTGGVSRAQGAAATLDYSKGAAIPPEACGTCHIAIYREYATGFGSDMKYRGMVYRAADDKLLALPPNISNSRSAHAFAGMDPFPIHAREAERSGEACNVCHFPKLFQIPEVDTPETGRPEPRPAQQRMQGVTCAGCHLTPEGKIRGIHEVKAPHETVVDQKIQTSGICAYCHSLGKRVPGKQTQTFYEWREDFYRPALGRQYCQDCHMLRTPRKTAEDYDVPVRAVARHLWTGGHSAQQLSGAATVVIVQPKEGQPGLQFYVINTGAGHSVPTGSIRRGLWLIAEVSDESGKSVKTGEWLFAPWYGDRPDDYKFLEEDKNLPDALPAMQADAQGPHEAPLRAGEYRLLDWAPGLATGAYRVKASLVYDLNRLNERNFAEDQTEIFQTSLAIEVK
jgi:hypothetical protein